MKKIMNFLTKSKGKVIIIIIIILAILSLIITFNQNKSNLNGNVGNNNKGNNTEYIPPNFGDTNFLFDSNRVSFSSDAMKSKNVKTAIDELYQALTTGCYVGYTKGTDNGTVYVCNKASSDTKGEIDFDSANVKYNNGTSGLSASNVKDAIDELKGLVAYCSSDHHKENETSNSYECRINTQPSTLTVANSSVALTYNGSSANNTYSYNGDGEISCSSSDTTKVTCSVDTANTRITVTPVAATTSNVTITVSASQTANYYAPTDATFTVSVAPIEATCPTISGTTNTYNGSSRTINVSGGANGTIQYSTDNSTWSTTKPTRTNAGTTKVYVRIYATGNYKTKTCGSANIVINAAAATFSCSNKTYNGSAQTGCTCSGCTITGGTNSATNVGGPWTVTASANTNYTLSTTSKTWSITAKSLTLKSALNNNSCSGTSCTLSFRFSNHIANTQYKLTCTAASGNLSGGNLSGLWDNGGNVDLTVFMYPPPTTQVKLTCTMGNNYSWTATWWQDWYGNH